MNPKEAAKYLGISLHWLNSLRSKGREGKGPKFSRVVVGPRLAIRYDTKDLDTWKSRPKYIPKPPGRPKNPERAALLVAAKARRELKAAELRKSAGKKKKILQPVASAASAFVTAEQFEVLRAKLEEHRRLRADMSTAIFRDGRKKTA